MKAKLRFLALSALFSVLSAPALSSEDPEILPPSATMTQYLDAQRDYIRRQVDANGSWLNNNVYDLKTFQRYLDDGSFDKNDRRLMQAIGVYIGDLLSEATYGNFRWSSYEDDKGKSRALCLRDQLPCVFPVTLISRRVEGDVQVDILQIYERVLDQLTQVEIK